MFKKKYLVSLIAMYAVTHGSVTQANTANNAKTEQQLDQIVVTATKTERELVKTPVSTEVITQAEIEAIGANNLKDIFTNIPGVFMNPSASSMSIRGVGGKGTLLLIDGRRIGSEYSNVYDSTRISANSIERIEIVKGPAGALYGSDALGGVINIITKKPEDGFEASIGANSGLNTDGQGAITQVEGDLRGKSGDTGFSAWFSAQNAESYTEKETAKLGAPKGGGQPGMTSPSQSNFRINPNNNMACGNGGGCPAPFSQSIGNLVPNTANIQTTYQSPAEVLNVGGQLTHDVTKALTLKANASYMKETQKIDRIGSVYTSDYVNAQSQKNLPIANVPIHQELENERTDFGIGADYDVSETVAIHWQSSQSHYKKDDTITTPLWKALGYESQSDSASLSGTGDAIATDHQLTATWTPNENNRILIGGEYVEDKRKSAFFSGDGSQETKTIQTASAFAQHEWQVTQPLSLVYGLRYDERKSSDDAVTFNAGGVYQFNQAANLRLRYAQGFRSPDSQELYMNRYMPNGKRLLGADVVDASVGKKAFELKSERSDNYEIGLQGRGDSWSYDVAVYQNQITDSILKDASQSAGYVTFRNASKVDISGLEFTGSKQLMESIRLELYANLLDSKDQDTDKRLEYTPNQLYSLTVDYQMTSTISTKLIAQYVGDQLYSETVSGQTQYNTADAYTPVNLKLSYSPEALKNTEFYGGVDNILDTKVDKVLGSSVGTYVYAGARVYF